MAVLVKRYRKTIWQDASYTEHKESSSQNLTTKKGREKVKFTKTEYQQRLPFVIYVDFESVYVNKTRASDCYKNCSPSNISITYHEGAAST